MSGVGENEDRVQKGKALRFTGPCSKNEIHAAVHFFFLDFRQNTDLLRKETTALMHGDTL